MTKIVIFLADGMSDEEIAELDGKTPVEYAHTPNMDRIAQDGQSGIFLTLPDQFPTSSDVANMSVLGYDLAKYYCGRGPLEALSQGIELKPDDIAYRCNLVYATEDTLIDYSGGHIKNEESVALMRDLAAKYNCEDFSFYPGVSYRNLLVLHGGKFTDKVEYSKPDASQDMKIDGILPKPIEGAEYSRETCDLLIDLMTKTRDFLAGHKVNEEREHPANMIWPWSGGQCPSMPSFEEKYGIKGAIISAVDVIFGLGAAAGMELIHVDGATGFIDTNYEGKAKAAVEALERNDFVYVHVEAIDECGHLGDLDKKLMAIEDYDRRVMGPVMEALEGQDVNFAILPDHPVPIRLRSHTRTPVPFSICGPNIEPDGITAYGEHSCPMGAAGSLKGDELMQLLLGN